MTLLGQTWVFVHVYKTGGTSISKLLAPHGVYLPPPHAAATEVRKQVEDRGMHWADLLSIGFVRNPFDWVASTYHYIRSSQIHPEYATVRSMNLGAFVEHVGSQLQPHGLYYTLKQALCDEEGHVLVSFLGRYETLSADILRLKLAADAKSVPWANKTACRVLSWPEEYRRDPYARDAVLEIFEEDFDLFGYSRELPR